MQKLALALVALAAAACAGRAPPPSAAAATDAGFIAPLTEKWERVLPVEKVPAGLASLSAAECGRCHPGNYQEWRRSAHAAAWTDPQFQAEQHKDNLWACANCHVPLGNQQPFLVTGLENGELARPVKVQNPAFDPALREEGLTCAACHVRDGVILTPHESKAPHPTRKDPEALSWQLCAQCHDVTASFQKAQVCSFETVQDWKRTGLQQQGVTCLECHMPPVERVTMTGEKKTGFLHLFPGAGIPKSTDIPAFQRSGLVVSLDGGARPFAPGQRAHLEVRLTNANAGHSVPTSDVERFVVLRARLLDGRGRERWSSSARFGQTWQWWPAQKLVSDTRIARGETRTVPLEIPLPRDLDAACLELTLENHRITPENAAYLKLGESYPHFTVAYRSVSALRLAGRTARCPP